MVDLRSAGGGAPPPRAAAEAGEFRAGWVAVAGPPNVGKSTLVNAWLGEHMSIVSPKPQTTRQRVFGICSRPDGQAVFVDTPGLVRPRHRLDEAMVLEAEEGMSAADLLLYVCAADDPGTYPGPQDAERLRGHGAPVLLAVNRVDAVEPAERAAVRAAVEPVGLETWLISARTGEGLGPLLDRVLALLPPSPPLYPRDEMATQPVRFFVEEYIREAALELYGEEIPHSLVCRVEEFREGQDPVYIRVTVFVERASQKRIVIGRDGEAIRRLGTLSREKIEELVGRAVYLDLWVKVLPGWRRNVGRLRYLGFRVAQPRR